MSGCGRSGGVEERERVAGCRRERWPMNSSWPYIKMQGSEDRTVSIRTHNADSVKGKGLVWVSILSSDLSHQCMCCSEYVQCWTDLRSGLFWCINWCRSLEDCSFCDQCTCTAAACCSVSESCVSGEAVNVSLQANSSDFLSTFVHVFGFWLYMYIEF